MARKWTAEQKAAARERALKRKESHAEIASMQGINSLGADSNREVATGKLVKVRRLAKYKIAGYKEDGREILRPEFKTVELPTFFYKINMPPCGGSDMKINGMPLYHGATVELDIDTLRTVKDMVFRMWAHDREIHGSDENFYRKANKDVNPQNTISMRMTG